jgi:hypothetical protein
MITDIIMDVTTGMVMDVATDMVMAEAIANKSQLTKQDLNNPLLKPKRIIYFYKTVQI